MKKALFSLLVVIAVLVCIPVVAYAQIDKTCDEGVAWVLGWEDGGQCEFSCEWMTVGGITYDCRWQCVDFVNAYTNYLTGTSRSGNANDYNDGSLPDYDNYSLIQKYSGFVPAKGDILIWDGGTWGHVAIVTAVNSNTEIVYSDQNGGGYTQKIHHGRKLNPQTNDYWGVIRPDFKPITPTAPTVYASPIGTEVDISWNDVGASSYYIYVQNKDDQSIPYGNNVGRTFSIHLGLSAGNFNVYVTAVYSSDNMKTGSAEFTTSPLMATVNKGAESNYDLNEPVIINVNADPNAVDSCVLKIYRTPTGGDTYLYWEGQVFSPQYTAIFSAEGHYSCCYLFSKNGHTIESGWVGWNIIENNLCATVDKGQDGIYALNEPVIIGINADVNTVESCVLKIYRTPTDGETYLYWEGQLFSSQHKIQFSKEGYYSCCFILTHNNLYLESGWVGWIVKEPFTLPINLKSIEDEAFAGIRNCVIRVPDGVTTISPTAFDSSVTLIVKSGTEAAEAVKDLELNVITE